MCTLHTVVLSGKMKIIFLLCFLLSVESQDIDEERESRMKEARHEIDVYEESKPRQTEEEQREHFLEDQLGMEEGELMHPKGLIRDGTSTTEGLTEIELTALPESLVRDILNLDKGKYTTQKFNYFNNQNYRIPWHPEYNREGPCVEQYMRCLLSLSHHYNVCGYQDINNHNKYYVDMPTYCHIYYDNCNRGIRLWAAYKMGPCQAKFHSHSGFTYFAGYNPE